MRLNLIKSTTRIFIRVVLPCCNDFRPSSINYEDEPRLMQEIVSVCCVILLKKQHGYDIMYNIVVNARIVSRELVLTWLSIGGFL